jgi:hypothetical protein
VSRRRSYPEARPLSTAAWLRNPVARGVPNRARTATTLTAITSAYLLLTETPSHSAGTLHCGLFPPYTDVAARAEFY